MNVHHRKTRKSYDTPGDSHYLTFSTFKRIPLLTRVRSCDWIVDAIRQSKDRNPFKLWAWVVMPEHVHLLIHPHPKVKISSILKSLKQSVSNKAILWLKKNSPEFLPTIEDIQPNGKRSYRFWQRGGGYDRNLRSVRDIHEKILYIHRNPVARKLVVNPTDYAWSSAIAWKTGQDHPLVINRSSVPTLTRMEDTVNSKLWY